MSGYIYWAMQVPSPQANWSTIATDAGKVPSVGTLTVTWPTTFASIQSTLDYFRTQGAHACIDWFTSLSGSPATNLRNPGIIAGQQDAYLNTWFAACAAWGHPLVVILCSEMNGTWYPAFSDNRTDMGNYAGSFKAMYDHVVALGDANGCTNITWALAYNVQSPDGSGAATAETTQPMSQFYSTAHPPDLLLVDSFNYAGSRPTFAGYPGLSFDQIMRGVGATAPSFFSGLGNTWAHLSALDPNTPLGIGSFGCDSKEGKDINVNWATAAHVNGTVKGAWFTDALTVQMQSAAYSRLKFFRYYNTDHASIGPPYSGTEYPNGYSIGDNDAAIETPTAAATGSTIGSIVYTVTGAGAQQTAWQTAIGSSFYLAGGGFTLPSTGQIVIPYVPPTQATGDNYAGLQDSVRGLVGHWRLGETNKAAGQAAVDRTSALNGTYTGTCVDVASLIPGSVDHALSLNGTSYVTVPDNTLLSPEAVLGKGTRECWYQESAVPGATQALFAKGTGANWEMALQRTTTGFTLAYYTSVGNNHAVVVYTVTPTLNVRHHLACVYSLAGPAVASLYYDGVLVSSAAIGQYGSTVMTDGTAAFTIGRRAAGDQPAGSVGNPVIVDEVTVRNSALDASEVLRLYNAGNNPPFDQFLNTQTIMPNRSVHFRLGETNKAAAQVATDTVSALNGVYTGTCTDVASLVPGSFDHALSVAGSGYVVGTDNDFYSPQVTFGTGTWEVWWQESVAPAATQSFVSKMQGTTQFEYDLRRTTTGVEFIVYQAVVAAPVHSGASVNLTPSLNVPHQLVGVYNASATNKTALYMDGVLVATGATLTGVVSNTTALFQIGRRALGDNSCGTVGNPVYIGQVVVRSSALSATDVLRLYYAGIGRYAMATVI